MRSTPVAAFMTLPNACNCDRAGVSQYILSILNLDVLAMKSLTLEVCIW